jgi:hypothetical protein
MNDINMELINHGKASLFQDHAPQKQEKSKNNVEIQFDQLLENLIDKLFLLDLLTQNQLIPKSIRREKLKEDLRSSKKYISIDISLEHAFEIVKNKNDCLAYLNPEEYKDMVAQLSKIPLYIKQVDFSQPLKSSLYSLLHLTTLTMQAILKVGLGKYNENDYQSSFAIFALLSSLDYANNEYWYRLGITANKIGEINLALQAFAYALFLKQNLLGARIFSAECYLKLNQIEDVKAELLEAKKIMERNSPPDQIWLDLISIIEKAA